MNPHRRAVPVRCSERHVPRRRHGGGVDRVSERADSRARGLVARPERAAAASRGRAARRIDAPQRSDELREIDRCASSVEGHARRVFALEPVVDRPLVRVPLAGRTAGNWRRHAERQERRQLRQPLELLVQRPSPPATPPRQPNGELVAQPVDRVVGPAHGQRFDRELRPLRELHRK